MTDLLSNCVRYDPSVLAKCLLAGPILIYNCAIPDNQQAAD